MRFSAEHWRQRAQEARSLATGVLDREVRQALLRIADEYAAKARQTALDEMTSGQPRPAEQRFHDTSRDAAPRLGAWRGK
jgi:hypothetical protein